MTPRSASTRPLAAASFAAKVVARALTDDSSLNPQGKCDRAVPRPKLHPWKALHACNAYESVSAIVDAQSSSGMFPEVVTRRVLCACPTESSLFECVAKRPALAPHPAGESRGRRLRARARPLLRRRNGCGPHVPYGRLRTGAIPRRRKRTPGLERKPSWRAYFESQPNGSCSRARRLSLCGPKASAGNCCGAEPPPSTSS